MGTDDSIPNEVLALAERLVELAGSKRQAIRAVKATTIEPITRDKGGAPKRWHHPDGLILFAADLLGHRYRAQGRTVPGKRELIRQIVQMLSARGVDVGKTEAAIRRLADDRPNFPLPPGFDAMVDAQVAAGAPRPSFDAAIENTLAQIQAHLRRRRKSRLSTTKN
jgi:hypothetical protein